jgi:hypothetical protein
MDLSLIETHLTQQLADLRLREIGQAAGLDAVMSGTRPMPSIYLVPLSEKGSEIDSTGPVCVLENRLFGVIYVLDVRGDTTGARGSASLSTLRNRVKAALIGFVPEQDCGEPVVFEGGELVQFSGDGRLIWSDEFVFKGYFRSTQ